MLDGCKSFACPRCEEILTQDNEYTGECNVQCDVYFEDSYAKNSNLKVC